jgi:hypothetical protein
MFETVIMLLIQICLVAVLAYIVIWVLGILGVTIPPRVVQLLWVIVALIVILLLYRALWPVFGGGRLF